MITNNDIRILLRLPEVSATYEVSQVDSLGLNDNTLMFINKYGLDLSELDNSLGSVYLIDSSYTEYLSCRNDFIRVDNPKLAFCRVVEAFNLPSKFQRIVPLGERIIIGNNCHIDSGTIIGGIDFSPVLGDAVGELVQFPQMGGVKLGKNVVVKYNSMIGRGTFGYTEIGDYTMIDYGCQIGHNCRIGRTCIIAAGTIIGGSTEIGDNVVIGIGAMIRNGIKIGDGASIGMGSVVIKDVPPGAVVVGNPARIIDHKKIFDKEGLK